MQKNLGDLELFYQLKKEVLLKYLQTYPYWEGTLANFGNKEIAQLQDLIEKDLKQRISEKWVYTHLKPIENSKLPRKDMLDILANWTGYSGWDEFKVKEREVSTKLTNKSFLSKRKINVAIILLLVITGIVSVLFSDIFFREKEYNICFYNQYTQKKISENNFSIFLKKSDKNLIKQTTVEGCAKLMNEENSIDVTIESPYYKDVDLNILMGEDVISIYLQPDDYAMMLRMCMNSEENWGKRREQLYKIITDDAEIIEVMYDDIGVEFLNKEEFIDKITIPIESTKTMEIIDIEYSEDDKIKSLKFIQKNEQ